MVEQLEGGDAQFHIAVRSGAAAKAVGREATEAAGLCGDGGAVDARRGAGRGEAVESRRGGRTGPGAGEADAGLT